MTQSSNNYDGLEDALLRFAVEEKYDLDTLARYIAMYPQYKEELEELCVEFITTNNEENFEPWIEDEESFQKAWIQFTTIPQRNLSQD